MRVAHEDERSRGFELILWVSESLFALVHPKIMHVDMAGRFTIIKIHIVDLVQFLINNTTIDGKTSRGLERTRLGLRLSTTPTFAIVGKEA